MRAGNLKRGIPPLMPDELFSVLARGTDTRIERIVSRGHVSPPDFWYDQEEAELVLLLEGHARIEIEGEGELDLSAFDWLELMPHVRHRVSFTAPGVDTIWLAIFFKAAGDDTPALKALAAEPDHAERGEGDEGER